MSCPRNTFATINPANSNYVGGNSTTSNNIMMTNSNRAQYNNNLTQSNAIYLRSKCRQIVSAYPSFTPSIFSLSIKSSIKGVYSVVYIDGKNFLPPANGTTYVNFGPYKELPIIFLSATYISFTIPLNAKAGDYSVVVVNVYNGNFSPQVNYTYSGILNFSNAEVYTIT